MKGKSKLLLVAAATMLIAVALTRSIVIGSAIFCTTFLTGSLRARVSEKKSQEVIGKHIPELIDHLISGVQSGLSLAETLQSLADRGPTILRPFFATFSEAILSGETFESAINQLAESIGTRSSDQLFEALLMARKLGGAELLSLLRQLGEFTREEIALREEVHAKQSWIRNSAHLSSAAPWLLLILLSTQPATAAAFSTPAGGIVMAVGIAMTAFAYLWMGMIARMPAPKRIFGVQ